ncbi:unnamed protein product [Rotaria socialis]
MNIKTLNFVVFLRECLTGEIPNKDFDQKQVAFGIATNKYSLPISTTCSKEFSQLIKVNYSNNDLNNMESNGETYFTLEQNRPIEIQDILVELRPKEKEIRDCERVMLELTVAQNHQLIKIIFINNSCKFNFRHLISVCPENDTHNHQLAIECGHYHL